VAGYLRGFIKKLLRSKAASTRTRRQQLLDKRATHLRFKTSSDHAQQLFDQNTHDCIAKTFGIFNLHSNLNSHTTRNKLAQIILSNF